MGRILDIRVVWVLAVYVLLDLACVLLGMGIPIFSILLGIPVGWYVVERCAAKGLRDGEMLSEAFFAGVATASLTFCLMGLVWGPSIALLFRPGADLAGVGIPLILYDATASFIGWLVLMIVISPILQVLMTLFGAHLTLTSRLTRTGGELVRHV